MLRPVSSAVALNIPASGHARIGRQPQRSARGDSRGVTRVARPAVPVYQASSTQVLPAAQPASYRAAPPRRSRPGMVALVALALFLAGAIAMFALSGLFDDTAHRRRHGYPPIAPRRATQTPPA